MPQGGASKWEGVFVSRVKEGALRGQLFLGVDRPKPPVLSVLKEAGFRSIPKTLLAGRPDSNLIFGDSKIRVFLLPPDPFMEQLKRLPFLHE